MLEIVPQFVVLLLLLLVLLPGSHTVTEVKIPLKYGAEEAVTVPGPLGPKPIVTGTVLLTAVDPVKDTVCVPEASTIVRVPVHGPLPNGENVTLIVQLPLPVTLEPQLLVWPKSPEMVMLETASALELLLLSVTV